MEPEAVTRIWEADLAYVRDAHARGEDAELIEALAASAARDPAAKPKVPPLPNDEDGVLEAMRRYNFALWHIEDEARRLDVPDRYIATAKRWIDRWNQARNDAMEALDALLAPRFPMPPEAPLHTETPGVAFDRLAVLSLKVYHTAEEAERADAGEAHRAKMRERLARLTAQGEDLRAALRSLISDLAAGRRAFRLYKQFKMYNDPQTNPALRKATSSGKR